MSPADAKHDRLPNTDRRIFPRGWTDVGAWSHGGTFVGMMIRLTLRWMFEAAVGNGAQKFTLQQEVAETGRVDTDVAALLVGAAADSQVAFFGGITIAGSGSSCGGGGSSGRLELLVGVVDEIFFVRHGDVNWRISGWEKKFNGKVGKRISDMKWVEYL